MDFNFTPDQDAFRQDVAGFLARELPDDWALRNDREEFSDEEREFAAGFRKKLADRGWLTMAWPKQYGGQDASALIQTIYMEEMSYRGAPGAYTAGSQLVGPALMLFGTEEQRSRFLPRIADDSDTWFQLFSEPGAGSDLASLQTRADRDGDDYVINGQKIWSSGAHQADWGILLARTDPNVPKHKGISYFLVDMNLAGISVRPLVNMMGSHHFNEVFFDNLRLPREYLVGEENNGWYQAATTLDFERSSINRVVMGKRAMEETVRYAKVTRYNGGRLWDRVNVRNALVDLYLGYELGRLLCYRVAWMQSSGQVPNYEASISKMFGSELNRQMSWVTANVLGPAGLLDTGSKHAVLDGRVARWFLAGTSYTVAAGTSEIQRNIIASRGLGLPRG